MNADNPNAIWGMKQPTSFLQSRRLAGGRMAGIFDSITDATAAPSATPGIDSSNVQTIMTAVNSESVFVTNLIRSWQGLPPLPAQATAPTVNVGVSSELQTVLLAGGAILVLFLLRGRRGKAK